MLTSGIIFVISGVLTLIPVCWMAHTFIQDLYDPLLSEAQTPELRASFCLAGKPLGSRCWVGHSSAAPAPQGGPGAPAIK